MELPEEMRLASAMSLAAAAKAHSLALGQQAAEAVAARSTYSTLELGSQADGRSWETGCARLGMTARTSIFGTKPGKDQLVEFFRTPCEWIYISGHYHGDYGYLYSRDRGVRDGGIQVDFFSDGVDVNVGGKQNWLTKGGDFRLHLGCRVLVLAACSTLRVESRVRVLRALFNNPVLLGYGSGTNATTNAAMMGGGLIANSFFGRLRSKRMQNDPDAARNAWMETAKAKFGRDAPNDKFRAVDADGQMWTLSGGNIVKGPKL
jgi:hypothetical protein